VNVGFRVLKRKRAIDAELIAKFKSLPVANISDSMNRMTAGGSRLRPMHAGGVLCGAAITVKTRPGDNLLVHMALNIASAGDVVVVDAGGELTNSIVGERMLAHCEAKAFAGVVIDGAVRDYGYIKSRNFPVFAAGISHRGPYKDGPGEVNVPIALDGMVIEPGDLVIGDDDGLLCVPFDQAAEIYELARAKHASEMADFAQIAQGTADRSSWIKRLRELGCEIEE
jgi:regulator of RNase E activity RraA